MFVKIIYFDATGGKLAFMFFLIFLFDSRTGSSKTGRLVKTNTLKFLTKDLKYQPLLMTRR